MSQIVIKEWLGLALQAMDIAFTPDGLVKKDLAVSDKKKAVTLLKQVTNKYKADEAWPYIKLAELVDEENLKFNLYYESIKYEDTIYAYKFLYKTLLKNNPKIVLKYIDDTI